MIYTACFIKNIDSVNRTYLGKELSPNEEYQIPDNLRDKWATDNSVLTDIVSEKIKIGNGTTYFSTFTEQIAWIRNEYLMTETKITSSTPFAEPLYRTKLDGGASVLTVAPDTIEYLDYKLTEEKYLSGGELLVKDFEFGDWICAAVYDKDEVIPEGYRAATCEAWPIVAQYIVKRYVKPDADGYGFIRIDTKPLNAKVTANLYLRVGYHSTSAGTNRKIVMNYDLTKKL